MALILYRLSYDTKLSKVIEERFTVKESNELYIKCYFTDVTGNTRYMTVYKRNLNKFDPKDRMFTTSNDYDEFLEAYVKHMRQKQKNLSDQINDIEKIVYKIITKE